MSTYSHARDNINKIENKIENTYSNVRDNVRSTAGKVENKIEHTYDAAREKVERGLDRLKHVKWSKYEEDALRFGLSFVNAMSTPLIERPFLNLMILQQLDNHTENQVAQYDGYSEGFRKIIAEEGFKGLFKGLWPQFIYEVTKFGFRVAALGVGLRYIPERYISYDYLPFVVAGVEMASETISYPLQVVTTRMVAQRGNTKYTGVVDCMEKIAVENGTPAGDLNPFKPEWYAGFGAHVLSLFTYAGVEVLSRYAFDKAFGLSGDVVAVLNTQTFRPAPTVRFDANRNEMVVDHSVQLRDMQYSLVLRNPVCYGIAYLASYPFSVVATRQQAGDKEVKDLDVLSAVKRIVAREGVRGLYKGLLVN